MHALKTPAFLKPSRPSSPAPPPTKSHDGDFAPHDSVQTLIPAPAPRRPLTRLQNPFRRSASASPAPARIPAASIATPAPTPPPATDGGGYLDLVGLKFAEGVSRALATPSGPTQSAVIPATTTPDPAASILRGRKIFPPGRGAALGALIATELEATASDTYLHRATIRVLHRPLSVFLNNLSSLLLPLLPVLHKSPQAQLHAISLATLAGEFAESMGSLGLGASPVDGRAGDGLRVIRVGLESLVKRVVASLLGTVRAELLPLLDSLSLEASEATILDLNATIPTIVPRLMRSVSPPGGAGQSELASLLIGLAWKAMVALSSRPLQHPFPSTLAMTHTNSSSGGKTPPSLRAKKELPFTISMGSRNNGNAASPAPFAIPTVLNTPASSTLTPPTTPRFSSRLPLPSLSRPPSPKATAPSLTSLQQLAADAQCVYTLLTTLPTPTTGSLACEAVDEAFEGFEAFVGFLKWAAAGFVDAPMSSSGTSAHSGSSSTTKWGAHLDLKNLVERTDDAPGLIVLAVLLQLVHKEDIASGTIPSLCGITEDEYRAGCLAGFGHAEVSLPLVGKSILEACASRKSEGVKKEITTMLMGVDLELVIEWLKERIESSDEEGDDDAEDDESAAADHDNALDTDARDAGRKYSYST